VTGLNIFLETYRLTFAFCRQKHQQAYLPNATMAKKNDRTIVITGFGAFGDVCANPSECIVNELQGKYGDGAELVKDTNNGTVSFLFRVLIVSVEGCDALYNDAEIRERMDLGDTIEFIHLGVNARATNIQLELCAYNNMNFRIPDVSGNQPENTPIATQVKNITGQLEQLDLEEPLSSSLPLSEFCKEVNAVVDNGTKSNINGIASSGKAAKSEPEADLTYGSSSEANGELITLSSDPGRYLCNYVYFKSLLMQADLSYPRNAVFIHLPNFDKVVQSVQLEVVVILIRLVALNGISIS
jgi:pyroglutamyl-peptidase